MLVHDFHQPPKYRGDLWGWDGYKDLKRRRRISKGGASRAFKHEVAARVATEQLWRPQKGPLQVNFARALVRVDGMHA